ncbi:restriction endonuclease subunit S [Vibrio fluvialis]|nr:restriction endonuclease subunit S [Vibrio fluvialis]
MSVEKKVPEIRFKGFSWEWGAALLKDVSTYSNGGSFENDVKAEGKYELVTLKSVDMNGNLVSSGRYIDVEVPTLPKDSLVMILSEQSPGLLGMTARIPVSDKYVLNQRVAEIRPLKNIESYFLSMAVNRNQRYFSERGAGTKVQNISKPNVENYEFLIPKKEEQAVIGNYFQKLDNLINQHQQKHAKLSNIKKAMLEKMFPKQGETIPEIRFKGFSGEWEESSLAEEAVVTTGYPFDSADFSEDGDLLVVTNGNIQNSSSAVDGKVGNRIASEKVTHLNQYKLNFGDILVTMDGSVGRTAKVIDRNQILAQRVGRLVARNDTEFLYQSLNTGAFLETMTTISHGGTIKHISLSEIGSYIVHVPKDLNEQAKIGAYLKKLDDLIERHHKQITKLNNIKQACLSKMFV